MKDFKSVRIISRLLIIMVVFAMCLADSPLQASAASKKISVSASDLAAGQQLTFTNMPYKGIHSPISEHNGQELAFSAIQNFDFTPDGKYVFTASKCFTGSVMHTLITRCSAPSAKGPSAEAECLEAFVLDRYGHGEVLAITQSNPSVEQYDLWVGCNPSKYDGHATAIARLTYRVGSDGRGSIVKTVKITGFKKANVNKGKAAFFKDKVSPMWVIAAVDTKSNQVVFRLRFKEGYGCTYLSYNYKKLNAALNKTKNNGTYNIAKAAKWQMARVKYSGSIQSFDIDGKNIYMTDGKMGGRAIVRVLPYKTQKNKKLTDQKKTDKNLSRVYTITPDITVNGIHFTAGTLELEGIKVLDGTGRFYINFFQKGKILRDTMTLYMVAK